MRRRDGRRGESPRGFGVAKKRTTGEDGSEGEAVQGSVIGRGRSGYGGGHGAARGDTEKTTMKTARQAIPRKTRNIRGRKRTNLFRKDRAGYTLRLCERDNGKGLVSDGMGRKRNFSHAVSCGRSGNRVDIWLRGVVEIEKAGSRWTLSESDTSGQSLRAFTNRMGSRGRPSDRRPNGWHKQPCGIRLSRAYHRGPPFNRLLHYELW